ncbi:DUF1963 domain-containing protein [Shimia aestuarii]|uniref:DUF1963 domain-containing protein n=1 Tax=Shimia aestuarii TaxID=254406 RepID=UPI001FB3F321|nr:DUF1963 domain-containing protein [Shimia aestuarii]
MNLKKLFSLGRNRIPKAKSETDWRSLIERRCSSLSVGGFRPSGELTSSCFGEVRASRKGEIWPELHGEALWPVCQLNLLDAPFVPDNLSDIALLQVFVSEDYWSSDFATVDSSEEVLKSPFFIRVYDSLAELQQVKVPSHKSPFKAFEARWNDQVQVDYPTHDTMPIDFDQLGIGDYYDQEGIDGVLATKLGGWPSCIQSEPWWDYRMEGQGFEYALQLDSEEKANCWWGDAGTVYIARHKTKKHLWAIDFQCY